MNHYGSNAGSMAWLKEEPQERCRCIRCGRDYALSTFGNDDVILCATCATETLEEVKEQIIKQIETATWVMDTAQLAVLQDNAEEVAEACADYLAKVNR